MRPVRWLRMGPRALDFEVERENMVERQLRRRGIKDSLILDAFREVPREAFVDKASAPIAYGDHPVAIEAGQTISQPYVVALMLEAAQLGHGDKVLEVGAGSGYAAALMSRVVRRVFAVERHQLLAERARERLRSLGFDNIEIVVGDGSRGLPREAPFDAILVPACAIAVPPALVDQLAPGGRLVMPVGSAHGVQRLLKVSRRSDGSLQQSDLGQVRFVPLIVGEASNPLTSVWRGCGHCCDRTQGCRRAL